MNNDIQPSEAVNNQEILKQTSANSDDEKIEIKRGKVGSITIYEVNESELQILESGSPNSVYFNLFSSFISIMISFLVTLFTVDFSDKSTTHIIFIFITILTFFLSLIMGVFALRNRNSISKVIKNIKLRVK